MTWALFFALIALILFILNAYEVPKVQAWAWVASALSACAFFLHK
jgi:hypothetical protein